MGDSGAMASAHYGRAMAAMTLGLVALVATFMVIHEDTATAAVSRLEDGARVAPGATRVLRVVDAEARKRAADRRTRWAQRMQLHRSHQCQRASAAAARDTAVAVKFAKFAKMYEQHCVQFKYSCEQNKVYKHQAKHYTKTAAKWRKRMVALRCKH